MLTKISHLVAPDLHPHITPTGRRFRGLYQWDESLHKGLMTMTKLTLAAHPHLLGFDQIERLAERASKGAEGYPPYNIEHHEPDGFTITLAVAGFAEDDLSISLENSQLTIAGRQPDPGKDRVFLHRGIASRAFQRSFVLADGVEVDGARLENGLLSIALRRRPQQSVVQTIPISRT